MHLPLELGLSVPDGTETPALDGFVTFISFIIFGSVPMWTYVIAVYGGKASGSTTFYIACATTVMTLFSLGWTQATITGQPRFKTALLMAVNGGLAAASAYLVGWGLEQAVGTGGSQPGCR